MLSLLASLALAADCPREPSLRDPDGEVTALSQNLKFIITGEKRRARNELFAEWLREEGAGVDLLLLSEARLTGGFEAWAPEWCFYTQVPDRARDGYRWAPIADGRPPAGLALGVRQRDEGEVREIGTFAGKKYRAKPTSLAEGFLGRLFNFEKGWAGVDIGDTHLVWSHTQASYWGNPAKGAGREGEGRAGQFADLAEDLGKPERATLLTGDLNLLAGFRAKPEVEQRIADARARDAETVARFREKTGIDLGWPWAPSSGRELAAWPREDARTSGAGEAAVAADAPVGTFAGGVDRRTAGEAWDAGAPYDRVGVNAAFLDRHPGTRVRPVEIVKGWLGVSDHLGLEISIPFGKRVAAAPPPEKPTSKRRCALAAGKPVVGRPVAREPLRLFALEAPAWLEASPVEAPLERSGLAVGVENHPGG